MESSQPPGVVRVAVVEDNPSTRADLAAHAGEWVAPPLSLSARASYTLRYGSKSSAFNTIVSTATMPS